MRNFHAQVWPCVECKDASLASQSEKASTLIPEILKRFTATGVMPNSHLPSEALDPAAFPESFVDGMNMYTDRRNGYDDENIAMADGLERDFVAATQPSAAESQEAGDKAPSAEDGGSKDGE